MWKSAPNHVLLTKGSTGGTWSLSLLVGFVTSKVEDLPYMNVATVELVLCDSYTCKFKGIHVVFSNERKIQKDTCNGCNNFEALYAF